LMLTGSTAIRLTDGKITQLLYDAGPPASTMDR
jgi:hypothetical protein